MHKTEIKHRKQQGINILDGGLKREYKELGDWYIDERKSIEKEYRNN